MTIDLCQQKSGQQRIPMRLVPAGLLALGVTGKDGSSPLSLSAVYAMVERGELPAMRIGGRAYVSVEDLERCGKRLVRKAEPAAGKRGYRVKPATPPVSAGHARAVAELRAEGLLR